MCASYFSATFYSKHFLNSVGELHLVFTEMLVGLSAKCTLVFYLILMTIRVGWQI
jgi:hypothetical protein